MSPPPNLDDLSSSQLKELVVRLLDEVTELKQTVAQQREEIARLERVEGPARDQAERWHGECGSARRRPAPPGNKPHRGKVRPSVSVAERVLKATAPAGLRFKGYESYMVQEFELSVHAIRYRRERWGDVPDGQTIIAPLPEGIEGHFGPDLRRFVLMQVPPGSDHIASSDRPAAIRNWPFDLQARGPAAVDPRSMRTFSTKPRDVLRAGLETSPWISVDDTGARHKVANGFCTQIGDDRFTWFGTRPSKSRLNFLDLLRVPAIPDFVLNSAAFDYMRAHALSATLIASPRGTAGRHSLPIRPPWSEHLDRIGFHQPGRRHPTQCRSPRKEQIWGSIHAHDFLRDAVMLSDDAGQFAVGRHALCWVHPERLVHKLDGLSPTTTVPPSNVCASWIWDFYAALKTYQTNPDNSRRLALRARFDRIFRRRTGFVTLDRLLARLHANKAELLMVLDRPETPLKTNGSENDIRCQVTRRKVSAGTRSDLGRDCRDAFLGLTKTCTKLGVTFWDYLGSRLRVPGQRVIQPLSDLVRCRGQPA